MALAHLLGDTRGFFGVDIGGGAAPTPEQMAEMAKKMPGGMPGGLPPTMPKLPPNFPGLPGLSGTGKFPGLPGLPNSGKKK